MDLKKAKLKFTAITLFPEMFSAVTDYGVVGRAIKKGDVVVSLVNPRDFTTDRHKTVDDRPYGGGPGMLMKVEPLLKTIKSIRLEVDNQCSTETKKPKVIYFSPQGEKMDHQMVARLAREEHLILIAGRYEGVDERIVSTEVDLEVSLGDFVLSGGELPAMALVDSVTRLLPCVLGHQESAVQDSFVDGLLDCPHYTRPEVYITDDGGQLTVPEVLLGGDHKKIAEWRLKQQLGRTWLRRPELLKNRELTQQEQFLLEEFQQEHSSEK